MTLSTHWNISSDLMQNIFTHLNIWIQICLHHFTFFQTSEEFWGKFKLSYVHKTFSFTDLDEVENVSVSVDDNCWRETLIDHKADLTWLLLNFLFVVGPGEHEDGKHGREEDVHRPPEGNASTGWKSKDNTQWSVSSSFHHMERPAAQQQPGNTTRKQWATSNWRRNHPGPWSQQG